MGLIYDSLSISDIAALKAIDASKRVRNHFLTVRDNGEGIPSWYSYKSSASDTEKLPDIVSPTDGVGRWFRYASGSGGATFGGIVICTSECTVSAGGSGKAFQFYAAQSALKLKIQPSFEIDIQTSGSAIAVYRWSQEPNTPRTGQEVTPIITLPETGGEFTVNITSTYRWISVYATNPSNGSFLDGTCFVVNGNVITLLGYS